MEEPIRIPLRARDGSIRAYTFVDAADADLVNQWRWSLNNDGYAVRNERTNGKCHLTRMHRQILGLRNGDPREGDHKDLDKLNNSRANLRVLPKGANSQNQPGRTTSTSKYRGVSFNTRRRRWVGTLQANGRQVHVGYFGTEAAAATAVSEARRIHMPYSIEG